MKTTKEKSKSGKGTVNEKHITATEVISSRPWPTEGEIRDLAEKIYSQRIDRGEDGTAEDDWLEAEAYLKESQN